jgi:hypothetical protein
MSDATEPRAVRGRGAAAPFGSIAFGARIPSAGAPTAHRALVADGEDMRLQFYRGDECLGDMPLGPADAIRLASELLNAARRRMGRE